MLYFTCLHVLVTPSLNSLCILLTKKTHIDWLHDSPVQQLECPGTKEIKVVDIDQFGMSTDLPSIEGIYMRRCLRNAASII